MSDYILPSRYLLKLEQRIHNQRVALRENWMIIEERAEHRKHYWSTHFLGKLLRSNKEKVACEATCKNLQARIDKLEKVVKSAAKYISESPCDPDITSDQLAAWQEYNQALEELENE